MSTRGRRNKSGLRQKVRTNAARKGSAGPAYQQYRKAQAYQDAQEQHGEVRVLVKDGKVVSP